MPLDPGTLTRRLTIERPFIDESLDGAGGEQWAVVSVASASVQDVLPSRAEQQGVGISLTTNRSRVRTQFRTDITSDMRFVDDRALGGRRVYQIVAGPAVIGQNDGLEFMVENYQPGTA